jgi:hypothetical protein
MNQVATETCLNCGCELQGEFCHACGQKAAATHLGVHDVLHEAADEFLHLDGKILTTVKLLIAKPGQLTRELVEGRRARYVSPLRLYITFSVLYFFLFAVVPGARERAIRVTRTEGAITTNAPAETFNKFADSFLNRLPHVVLTIMTPIFAVLTFIVYRSRQPFFFAHLYYSLHIHAFMFLIGSVALPAGRAGTVVAMVVAIPYHFLALRRFFGERWGKTFAKGIAIAALYVGFLVLSVLVVIWITLREI